ncbi:MAG: glutamate 5-kinase [Verrucomicrobiia bacterium]
MKRKGRQRWVVKLGSGLLTREGGIHLTQLNGIVGQLAELVGQGIEVVLVSSGAVSAGMSALKLAERPKEREALQACASIGQPLLMNAYERAFAARGLVTAQILITYWDLDSRALYANAQRTVEHLLRMGCCVPVFNENDALAFEEIEMLNRFGDNDRLSGHIAVLVGADQLVILSTIDGLRTRPDGTGTLIRDVAQIDKRIEGYAGTTQSQRSVGGMISKLETAKMMLAEGIPMVIADGRDPKILLKLAAGEREGTRFEKMKGKR